MQYSVFAEIKTLFFAFSALAEPNDDAHFEIVNDLLFN
jgi:hypothetical protein